MAKNLTPRASHCKNDLLTKIGHTKYSQHTTSSYRISSASKTLAGSVLSQTKSSATKSVAGSQTTFRASKTLAGSVLSQTKGKKK